MWIKRYNGYARRVMLSFRPRLSSMRCWRAIRTDTRWKSPRGDAPERIRSGLPLRGTAGSGARSTVHRLPGKILRLRTSTCFAQDDNMKRILILGGGFGGVYTAMHLEH